jgi:O-antigen/teichoic acid export membrane protein
MSLENYRQIFHGSILSFLGLAIGYGLMYIFNFSVSRLLSDREAGEFFILFSLINFLAIFSRFGLDRYGLRTISIDIDGGRFYQAFNKIKFYILINLTITIIVIILFSFSYNIILNLLNVKSVLSYFFMLCSVIGLSLSFTLSQYLRAYKLTFSSAVTQLIVLYLYATFFSFIIIFYFGAKIEFVAISFLAASILSALVGYTRINQITKVYLSNSVKTNVIMSMKDIYSLLTININTLLLYIFTGADLLFLGIFRNSSEVAYYNAAAKTVLVVSVGLVAINSIMAPLVASSYNKSQVNNLKEIIKLSSRWSSIFSVIMFGFLVLNGDKILSFYGEAYKIAYLPLLILLIGQLVNASSGSVSLIIQMIGEEKESLKILAMVVTFMLISFCIFIPKYGIIATALINTLGYIVWNIALIIFLRRKIGFYTFTDNIKRIILFIVIIFILKLTPLPFIVVNIVYLVSLPFVIWSILFLEQDRLFFIQYFNRYLGNLLNLKSP